MPVSYTAAYWQPGANYSTTTSLYPIERDLGFIFALPHRNPVATPWFYGEDTPIGTRHLVMRPNPEYFAVDGILPTYPGGKPMVDIDDPAYGFDRSHWTFPGRKNLD